MTELQQIFMTNDSTGIVWNAIYANKAALKVLYVQLLWGNAKEKKKACDPSCAPPK